jgi:POT family proton-dependent oligopeptide transporter
MYLGGMVATVASVPSNITNPVEMMPIYTRLFDWLGMAGIACTVIALAVLPLMRKLDASHAAHAAANPAGVPTVAAEQ